MRFYDAHNHLQHERLLPHADRLVAQSRTVGVAKMVVNGATEQDWSDVTALANRYPDIVLPCYGLHPWYVHERSPNWREALIAALEARPSAVGEIGLDRWKSDLPWDGQEEVFVEQLRIAVERNLPASIHCLEAWGRMLELLQANPRPARGFLLHSFGGSHEIMERMTPLGAYYSFPGAFARERKTRQQDVFRAIPLDRILIETDAPDQQPPAALVRFPLQDQTGQTINHPANLPSIYEFIAGLRGLSVEALCAQVEENFNRLFVG